MNEKDILVIEEKYDDILQTSFDLEELDEKLQEQLDKEMEGLEFLKEESNKIGSPENLGNVVKDTIWEQFKIQMAATTGIDFIKENGGMTLDLRNSAHVQTTENFANGEIATHNTEINYQERYDKWQENFQTDSNMKYNNSNYKYENGYLQKYDNRSGTHKKVLKKNARDDFDKRRPKGSKGNNTNMDHTISAGEMIRDSEAAAHLSREKIVEFANSEANLNEMDAAANQSKGDSSMEEFLNSEKDGKKPSERFNIDEKKLRKDDKHAREKYKEIKEEGKKKSEEAGKKSQKAEAKRIGKTLLKAILMQLLADLVKKVISKLVQWFKTAKKEIKTLVTAIKDAIKDFFRDIKQHVFTAGDTFLTTIGTTLFDKIFVIFKKVWTIITKAWSSLKEAIRYIKEPANRKKPYGVLMLEAGKIVIAGLTGVAGIVSGEFFSGILTTTFLGTIQIPSCGSLASILGMLLGALVVGVIGAIIISYIEKMTEKKLKRLYLKECNEKNNEILALQKQKQIVNEVILTDRKEKFASNVKKRHEAAAKKIGDVSIKLNSDGSDFNDQIDELDGLLQDNKEKK